MTHRPVDTPTPRVCALPGCDNPVSPDPNTPDRRYCGIAHRKAARKRRRNAGATDPAPARSAEPPAAPAPVAQAAPPTAVFQAAGSAGSSGSSDGSGSDPATVAVAVAVAARPPRVLTGPGTRGPNGEPGLTRHGYRRLVPEPRNRWYQRSGRPFAARGVRPETGRRRRTRQVRGEPELWLSDAAPAAPAAPAMLMPTQPAAPPEPTPPPTPPVAASPAPAQSLTTPAPATTTPSAPTTPPPPRPAPPQPPAPRQPAHTPPVQPTPKPGPKATPKRARKPAPRRETTPAPTPHPTPEPKATPSPEPAAEARAKPAPEPERAEDGPEHAASSAPSAPAAALQPTASPAPTPPPADPPTVPIPVAKPAGSATAPIPAPPPAPAPYPVPFPPPPWPAPAPYFGPTPYPPYPGPGPYPVPVQYSAPAGLDYPYPAPAGYPAPSAPPVPAPAAPTIPTKTTPPEATPSTWRSAAKEALSATVSSLRSACAAAASTCRTAASSAWGRAEAAAGPAFAAPARRFGQRWSAQPSSAQPSSPERPGAAGDGHDLGAPLGRGEVKARRRAEKELARQEAAAVLAGTLLPGEAPPARRGRKRGAPRTLPAPIVPAADASQALWGQMREALLAALHSLANNRLRSLLTTIGIVVGVAAVIVMVAMGDGMRQQYQVQTDQFANQINISKAKMGAGVGTSRNLTDADVKALGDHTRAPAIGEISEAMGGEVPVTAGQQRARAQLIGAQLNYARLTDRKLVAGTWFTPAQINSGDRAVILGPQEVNLLYGSDVDPNTLIGQTVRLSHSNFKVQGVLETNGQADNTVIVPFEAARAHLTGNQNGKVDTIILKSTSLTNVDDAVGQAIEILDRQHNIRDASTRDYNVTTFTQELKKSMDFINYLTWFIVGIAAISLFVGGVGVANIMLVSVTERTREIGIRKAVGAKTTAILRQFLSEAVMLTGLGGLVGIAVGLAFTEAGIMLLPKLGAGDPDSEIPIPIMSAGPVLIAFLVSLVIGVLAGGYPAHRAARLRPIEALRFE